MKLKNLENCIKQNSVTIYKASLEKCRDSVDLQQAHKETLVKCYLDLGDFHFNKENYPEALNAYQSALDITLKHFGEEHTRTADSCHQIGSHKVSLVTTPLLPSHTSVRRKLFGEKYARTADSYHLLGITQYQVGDYTSALQSQQHALDVRRKLFGEEHASTADSYHSLGISNYTSALQSQ